MHRTIAIFSIAACFFFISCKGNSQLQEQPEKKLEAKSEMTNPQEDIRMKVDNYVPPMITETPRDQLKLPTADMVGGADEVAIIITEYGRIVIEFYPDKAPVHVANFKYLANAGFYDGSTFHRVVPGFVIQGGDPNSKDNDPRNDGLGGPPYSVPAEFSEVLHKLGILSMARSQDPNSAGSQFFICLGRAKHLDNSYSVFGNVIYGTEVVKDIGSTARDPRKNADEPAVKMRYVRIVKRSELGL